MKKRTYHTPIRPPTEVLNWIRKTYDYDSKTGVLSNKKTGRKTVGKNSHGYRNIYYNKKGQKKYWIKASHAIWFLYYGAWPESMIDHHDIDQSNDKIENLRLSDPSKNQANKKRRVNKKSSKYKGVWPSGSKWTASVNFHKEYINLGTFETEEEAALAYNEGALKYFKEHAKLNILVDEGSS